MKLEVNIEKKYAYSILGLLLILVGIVAVNAYAPGQTATPSVMGHTVNELEGAVRTSILGCSINPPTGMDSKDFVCGASSVQTPGGVIIKDNSITLGGVPKTSWPGSGQLSCVMKMTPLNDVENDDDGTIVSCPAGYRATGGGYEGGGGSYIATRPHPKTEISPTKWWCHRESPGTAPENTNGQCFVMCCKIA